MVGKEVLGAPSLGLTTGVYRPKVDRQTAGPAATMEYIPTALHLVSPKSHHTCCPTLRPLPDIIGQLVPSILSPW